MAEFIRVPKQLLSVFVAVSLIFSPIEAQSSSTPANELFVSAILLHRQAGDLPPEERKAKLREVRDLFDRILAEHPDSDPAEQIRTNPAPAGVVLADLPQSEQQVSQADPATDTPLTDLESPAGHANSTAIIEPQTTSGNSRSSAELDPAEKPLRRFQERYPDDFSSLRRELGWGATEELAAAAMDAFAEYGLVETASALSTGDFWGLISFARASNLDQIPTEVGIQVIAAEIATRALDIYSTQTGAVVDSARLVQLASPPAHFITAAASGASAAGPAISAGVVAGFEAHYAARASYSEDERFEEVSEHLVLADALRQIAADLERSELPSKAERVRDRADEIIELAAQGAMGVFKGSDGPVVAQMLREMDRVVQLLRAGEQQKAQDLFDEIHISAKDNAPGFFSLSTNNAYERYFMLGPQNRGDSLRAFDQLARILHAIFDEPGATEQAAPGRARADYRPVDASAQKERQMGPGLLGPWTVQTEPDLTLKVGEQGRGFAVLADGAATFQGKSLFNNYRAPELDFQRLAIFVDDAERRAVALFMRDGAERMALVDLEAGTVLNDAPRPFWRYGPTDDVIWDPSGRYAALPMPMAEYSTGLGIFELATGRYATMPDRAFDANALDSWLADSLETRLDGTVSVEVARERLDAYGTPIASDGTPPETRIIEIEAFFDGSVTASDSESASDETAGEPEAGAVANQVWDPRIVVSKETGIFNRTYGDLVSPIDELRAAGVSEDAIAFSRAFYEDTGAGKPGEFVAVDFTELGAVDLIGMSPAYTPNTPLPMYRQALAAQDGTVRRLVFPVEMNRDLGRYATDRASRRVLAGQPDPWVVDYYVTGHRRLPGGAQRFVLQGPVSGSCRVCEWIGHAIVYVDVDERGDVLRHDLVGVIADAAVPDEEITLADIVTGPDLQQYMLNKFGYNAGPMDGAIGPRTRRAIEAFQNDHCLPVTGGMTGPVARVLARHDPLAPPECAADISDATRAKNSSARHVASDIDDANPAGLSQLRVTPRGGPSRFRTPDGTRWVQLASRREISEARKLAPLAGDDARIFRAENGYYAVTGTILNEPEYKGGISWLIAENGWPKDSLLTRGEGFVEEMPVVENGPVPEPAFTRTETLRATPLRVRSWDGSIPRYQEVDAISGGEPVVVWGGPDAQNDCLVSANEALFVTCSDLRGLSDANETPGRPGENHPRYSVIVLDQPLSWHEARELARRMGGDLAAPKSPEAQAEVWSTVRQHPESWVSNSAGYLIGPWLGGYQTSGAEEPDGGWSWVTGEKFSYTNWISARQAGGRQPNDAFGVEDALVFMGRGDMSPLWNDYPSTPTGQGWQAEISAFVLEQPSTERPEDTPAVKAQDTPVELPDQHAAPTQGEQTGIEAKKARLKQNFPDTYDAIFGDPLMSEISKEAKVEVAVLLIEVFESPAVSEAFLQRLNLEFAQFLQLAVGRVSDDLVLPSGGLLGDIGASLAEEVAIEVAAGLATDVVFDLGPPISAKFESPMRALFRSTIVELWGVKRGLTGDPGVILGKLVDRYYDIVEIANASRILADTQDRALLATALSMETAAIAASTLPAKTGETIIEEARRSLGFSTEGAVGADDAEAVERIFRVGLEALVSHHAGDAKVTRELRAEIARLGRAEGNINPFSAIRRPVDWLTSAANWGQDAPERAAHILIGSTALADISTPPEEAAPQVDLGTDRAELSDPSNVGSPRGSSVEPNQVLEVVEMSTAQFGGILKAHGVKVESDIDDASERAHVEAEIARYAASYRGTAPIIRSAELPFDAGSFDPETGTLRICGMGLMNTLGMGLTAESALGRGAPRVKFLPKDPWTAFGSLPALCTIGNKSAVHRIEAEYGTGELQKFAVSRGGGLVLAFKTDPETAALVQSASERGEARSVFDCRMEYREHNPPTPSPYDHNAIGTCIIERVELRAYDREAGHLTTIVFDGVGKVMNPIGEARGEDLDRPAVRASADESSAVARAVWTFQTNAGGEAAIRDIVEGFAGGPVEVILGYANAFPFQTAPSKQLAVDVFGELPEAETGTVSGPERGYGSFVLKNWSELNRYYFKDEPAEGMALATLGTVEDLRILSIEERTGGSCEWSVTYRVWLAEKTPFGKALEQVSDTNGLTFSVCFRTTRDGYEISEYRYVDQS